MFVFTLMQGRTHADTVHLLKLWRTKAVFYFGHTFF